MLPPVVAVQTLAPVAAFNAYNLLAAPSREGQGRGEGRPERARPPADPGGPPASGCTTPASPCARRTRRGPEPGTRRPGTLTATESPASGATARSTDTSLVASSA